jgi:hypothetical protein
MNGKIKAKTQSGQQKAACPLENSAQNKLTAGNCLSVVERTRKWMARFTRKHI